MKDDSYRNEWPKEIDIFGDVAAATPRDIEKVPEVEATATGFAVRMNAWRNYVMDKRS
jgi:hypothetical protein